MKSNIGQKLREARENVNLTGEQVAKMLGKASNSFISRIENGSQKLSIDIMNRLCEIYKINILDLMASIKTEAQYQIRKGFLDNLNFRSDDQELSEAAKTKIKKVLPYLKKIRQTALQMGESPVELSDIGSDPSVSIKPTSIISAKRIGKSFANKLRGYLDLGHGPIVNIQSLIWSQLQIPICSIDLGNNHYGIYSKDSSGYPLIIFSTSGNVVYRSVFTIAHELGHHFLTSDTTVMDYQGKKNNSVNEKLADSFAQEFLVPSSSLDAYMKKEGLLKINLEKKHVVDLCEHFNVNYYMMLYVLKDNEYITNSQFNSLSDYSSIELEQYGYASDCYTAKPINLESFLKKLIAKGLRNEKISLNYASEILNMPKSEVKELI